MLDTKFFKLAANIEGDADSKKVALILPGRLDTKDYDCFNSHLKYFAGKGFYAISVDPPGTWESPGGIDLFTTTNYIKSVNELIEYFGNKPTLLLGHSRGGAVATLAGTEDQYVLGIILINPSLGAPTPPSTETKKRGVNLDFRDMPPGTEKTKEKKKFELPLSYFEDGKRYNDAEKLKECTKPKLIFYSTNDEFNSPQDVTKVFETIPEPKKLIELESTHDYRYFPRVIEKVNNEIGLFMREFNL